MKLFVDEVIPKELLAKNVYSLKIEETGQVKYKRRSGRPKTIHSTGTVPKSHVLQVWKKKKSSKELTQALRDASDSSVDCSLKYHQKWSQQMGGCQEAVLKEEKKLRYDESRQKTSANKAYGV